MKRGVPEMEPSTSKRQRVEGIQHQEYALQIFCEVGLSHFPISTYFSILRTTKHLSSCLSTETFLQVVCHRYFGTNGLARGIDTWKLELLQQMTVDKCLERRDGIFPCLGFNVSATYEPLLPPQSKRSLEIESESDGESLDEDEEDSCFSDEYSRHMERQILLLRSEGDSRVTSLTQIYEALKEKSKPLLTFSVEDRKTFFDALLMAQEKEYEEFALKCFMRPHYEFSGLYTVFVAAVSKKLGRTVGFLRGDYIKLDEIEEEWDMVTDDTAELYSAGSVFDSSGHLRTKFQTSFGPDDNLFKFHLNTVYVEPYFRGLGLGSALIKQSVAYLSSEGNPEITEASLEELPESVRFHFANDIFIFSEIFPLNHRHLKQTKLTSRVQRNRLIEIFGRAGFRKIGSSNVHGWCTEHGHPSHALPIVIEEIDPEEELSPEQEELVNVLQTAGAEPANGLSHVEAFFSERPIPMTSEMIFYAIGCGNGEDVLEYLIKQGAEITYKHPTTGQTALHVAFITGHWKIIPFLVSRGVDPDLTTSEGKTALDIARELYEFISDKLTKYASATIRIPFESVATVLANPTPIPQPYSDLTMLVEKSFALFYQMDLLTDDFASKYFRQEIVMGFPF